MIVRSSGDSLGKVAYHGKNGVSTVDYIITDHSPICAWIRTTAKFINNYDDVQQDLNSLEYMSPQYIWSSDSIEPFKTAMSTPEIQSLIDAFLAKDFEVNTAVELVQAVFIKAASMSLKLKYEKRKKKRQNICNKKWFDFESMNQRKELYIMKN